MNRTQGLQCHADIIDLMLATGARIGEVLALRWADIALDADRPNLTINGTIKTEPGKGTHRKAIKCRTASDLRVRRSEAAFRSG